MSPNATSALLNESMGPYIGVSGDTVHVVWREIDTLNQHRSSHYKHSLDGGITWGSDIAVIPPSDYGTMVSAEGANNDIPCAGAVS